MSDTKDGFFLYRSVYDAVRSFPDKEVVADFFLTVCGYMFEGLAPESDNPMLLAMFALVKPNLDNALAKSKAGKIGMEKRWHSDNKTITDDNTAITEAYQDDNKPITIKDKGQEIKDKGQEIKDIEKENIKEKVSFSYPAEFNDFWSEYPNKVGKQAALKAWKKINPSKTLIAEIVTAVRDQKNWSRWQREGGKFIPNPATWLNQGRWDDEDREEELPF